jgi:hypothetical protein
MLPLLDLTGLVAVATLFGSMAFFSLVVAPLVFVTLEAPTAGRLIRALFPWYYLTIVLLSLLAAGVLAPSRPVDASLAGLMALAALSARQILMPRINHYRDRMVGGAPGAETTFARLHRLSVWVNAAQLGLAFIILVRLGTD